MSLLYIILDYCPNQPNPNPLIKSKNTSSVSHYFSQLPSYSAAPPPCVRYLCMFSPSPCISYIHTWLFSKQDFTPTRALALIRHALGPGADSFNIEIRSVRPWTMSALVAESYSKAFGATAESYSKNGTDGSGGGGVGGALGGNGGSVLLLGDAAHQFPPAGGFGLNTGVQVCTCRCLLLRLFLILAFTLFNFVAII